MVKRERVLEKLGLDLNLGSNGTLKPLRIGDLSWPRLVFCGERRWEDE